MQLCLTWTEANVVKLMLQGYRVWSSRSFEKQLLFRIEGYGEGYGVRTRSWSYFGLRKRLEVESYY